MRREAILPASGIEPFGRIPSGLDVSSLDRGEAVILIVLAQHTSSKTSDSWPSLSTLAARAGMTRRSVQRALRRLEAKGVVSIVRGVGKGHVSSYTIVPKGVVQTTPLPKPKRCRPEPKKGSSRRPLLRPPPITPPLRRLEQIQKKRPASRAASENCSDLGKEITPFEADSDVWAALRTRGVGEPARTELARNAELTVQILDSVRGTGGTLVNDVRDKLYLISDCRARNEAYRKRVEAEERDRGRGDVQFYREQAAAKAIIQEHTPEQNRVAWERVKKARGITDAEKDGIPAGYVVKVAIELDADGFRARTGSAAVEPTNHSGDLFGARLSD